MRAEGYYDLRQDTVSLGDVKNRAPGARSLPVLCAGRRGRRVGLHADHALARIRHHGVARRVMFFSGH